MRTLDAFDLTGEVAVVTGGNTGPGEAFAKKLSKVGGGSRRRLNPRMLQEGGTRSGEVKVGGNMQSDRFSLQGMVNNAGIAHNVPSEEATDDDWRRVVSVNLDGVF